MTPEELRRDEANRWLASASKDLNAATILVAAEPTASVFHSQQVAEKSAKAFLSYNNISFRKIHDLKELGAQCSLLLPSLLPLMIAASDLNAYAVVFRYLDAPREPDEAEAVGALEIARRLYDQVCALLAAEQESG
jgi:HEPN domain-containing protein